ncbi:MAG: hypothetical protein EOP50_20750, partial [Sphingobacteriales bacterium]
MNLPRILLTSITTGLLLLPAQAAEGKTTVSDPSIECGAFFTVMAQQAEDPKDADVFTTMSNTLLNEADGRLAGGHVRGG